MTLLTPEQIAAAQKANFDTLFGLTNKAFEGVEKLVELNLQVVKSTLAESQENAQRALSVKVAWSLPSAGEPTAPRADWAGAADAVSAPASRTAAVTAVARSDRRILFFIVSYLLIRVAGQMTAMAETTPGAAPAGWLPSARRR